MPATGYDGSKPPDEGRLTVANTPGESAVAQATALLADAVKILEARAAYPAERGERVWEPSPDTPALAVVVDEYAELADDAPAAVRHADSTARRGRAVAVSLIAAAQRPTQQQAMGQGAVRSQLDVHALNAPGKFLITAAEHCTPQTRLCLPHHRPGRSQHRRNLR